MADWFLIRKGGDYDSIAAENNISPVLARLLKNRGVEGREAIRAYLYGGEECFHDPGLLRDMDKACAVLSEYITAGRHIRIIGDYDIDGVCSTSILLLGIRELGGSVDAQIPHRVRDGYGMNCSMIDSAAEDGVELILTCDNGIAASKEAALAKERGIALVITDHHEVPYIEKDGEREYILPEAAAIVDPKREDDSYPHPGICGAFVAFKLMQSLFKLMKGEEPAGALRERMLQLAAFATVGDVMELKDENRAVVKTGMELMSKRPAPGLKELIDALGIAGQSINCFRLGFMLGPCVNATGRIDTAERALELLAGEGGEEAIARALELKELNENRKKITEEAAEAASAQIKAGEHEGLKVLVIYLPDCHESVAGIVAGRIRERYGLPTLIVTDSEEGLKGSGRSVEAYHMYDALSAVSDIFTKYGGHSQAAGFSLPADRLVELRQRLNENCTLTDADLREKIYVDLELKLKYATGELIDELAVMEPCGNGNTRALFGRSGLKLNAAYIVGADRTHCRLRVFDEDSGYTMMLFRRAEDLCRAVKEKYGEEGLEDLMKGTAGFPFSVLYYPKWNEYKGSRSIQLVVEDYKI
ncbi:MAG: single-stranded-DNA-specific exonuclease RecJ [Lachnospiraceae bacterium]|nr:single-stranded-DNA-specific exonuclease RecJ [Lachnospiraceae bacterium]